MIVLNRAAIAVDQRWRRLLAGRTGRALPRHDRRIADAGLADLDAAHGDPDLLVANSRGQAPALYKNHDGTGFFEKATFTHSSATFETLTRRGPRRDSTATGLDALFGNAGMFVPGDGFLGGRTNIPQQR